MGVEARFQAMPEDCELLRRARQDREIAELTESFNQYAREIHPGTWRPNSPATIYFRDAVRNLIRSRPGLIDRYHYAGRQFDSVVYLLSPQRRANEKKPDTSLIHEIIYGSELLHSEAQATQGYPIGFLNAQKVQVAAAYLDAITDEQLHRYYDPAEMEKHGVYKIHSSDGEAGFQDIWEEFVGIRNIYRAAADHGEAMITVID